MSLPNKKVKKIKVPASEDSYEIIPERLGKNGYAAELPTLTEDSQITLDNNIKWVLANNMYSSESTYGVGAIVYYDKYIYECITAVTTPEDFDYTKWNAVSLQTLIDRKQPLITDSNKLWSDYVTDEGATNKFTTEAEKTKLAGIAEGAEVNVQSDWNVTDSSSDAYIQHKPTLGTAAAKDFTTSVTQNSANLVTSGAVWTAIDNLPEPMVFKGTLGTGGTITSLPAASASNEGFTYKVITAGTYASQSAKVGDVFVSNGSSWVLIPAGDTDSDTWRNIKVNGTQLLGTGISTGAVNFKNGSNVTITGSGNDITISADDAASTTHTHKYTPSGSVSLGSNTTASGGVAYVASVSGTSASGSGTTKYLHKTTTNAAPNAHTHTVTVSGTTGANSGTAVSAVTGVAADGTATVNKNAIKAVELSASATSTDGPAYVQSVTHTAASLTGTKTFNTNAIKSVSLSASETSTDGPKYIQDVTHTAASLTGTKTFNTDAIKGVTLSASETSTDGPTYVESVTHTAASLTGTKTFNTDAIKAVELSASTTSTDGPTYVQSISGGSAVTKTTKYMKFTPGTTPASSASPEYTSTNTGNNSGTKVVALTAINGGSGKLESYDAATSGTKKVSDGTRIPYVAAQGTITGASYTPAGSVSLTNGTAPSMGAATTKYLSAAPSHTSTTSGNNSGTKVVAVTGYPDFSGGSLTGTKTFVTGVSGGSGSLTSNDTSTDGIKYISEASHTAASLGTASTGTVSISGGDGNLEAYDAATSGTKKSTDGSRIPFITSASHTAASLGTASTGTVGISGGSGSLSSNDTSTDGIKYVQDVSFSNGVLTLNYKYLHHSHTAASLTGTKTFVTGYPNFSGGSATHTTWYLDHTQNTPSLGGTKTFVTGYPNFSGGSASHTTKYLHHTHNAASASGTGTVGFTAASLGTPTTGDAAPHTHTHSYDKTTGVTLTANDATATGRITYVQAQGTFSAGTTPKASASFSGTAATITPTLGAATTYYLEHSHTGASAKTTGDAAPHTHTHAYDKTTSISLTAGTAPSMNFDTGTNTDTPYISSISGGSAVSATTRYMKVGTTAASTGTVGINGGSITPVTKYMKAETTAASTGTVGISGGSISKTTRYMKATTTAADTGTVGISGGSIDATTKYMKVSTTAADTETVLTGVKASGTANVAPSGHTHSYGSSTPLTTSANSGSAVAAITGLAGNTTEDTGDIEYLQDYTVSGGTVSGTTKYFHPSFSGTEGNTGTPED